MELEYHYWLQTLSLDVLEPTADQFKTPLDFTSSYMVEHKGFPLLTTDLPPIDFAVLPFNLIGESGIRDELSELNLSQFNTSSPSTEYSVQLDTEQRALPLDRQILPLQSQSLNGNTTTTIFITLERVLSRKYKCDVPTCLASFTRGSHLKRHKET